MRRIDLRARGSAPEPWQVSFLLALGILQAFCACPAGRIGHASKHRLGLLDGRLQGLEEAGSPSVQDALRAIQEALSGTPLAAVLANAAQVEAKVEATIAATKRRLAAVREAFAQAFGERRAREPCPGPPLPTSHLRIHDPPTPPLPCARRGSPARDPRPRRRPGDAPGRRSHPARRPSPDPARRSAPGRRGAQPARDRDRQPSPRDLRPRDPRSRPCPRDPDPDPPGRGPGDRRPRPPLRRHRPGGPRTGAHRRRRLPANPLPGTPRLRAPARARAGETVEIRLLLDHPMDSGRRRDGSAAPRQMLANLRLLLDGREIARLAFGDGASPNPFHVFRVRIPGPCGIAAVWTAEDGRQARVSHRIAA